MYIHRGHMTSRPEPRVDSRIGKLTSRTGVPSGIFFDVVGVMFGETGNVHVHLVVGRQWYETRGRISIIRSAPRH